MLYDCQRRARSTRPRRRFANVAAAAAAVTVGALGMAGAAQGVIVFGQIDDFENGTVMSWTHGEIIAGNPANVPDGGPNGAGDNYLRNNSVSGGEEHSRQVLFNRNQWAGNYNAAGVTRITGFMNNLGSTPLFMRVALEGAGSQFSSTNAIPLPVASGWQPVTFDLTPSAMTRVSGSAALTDALNNVGTLRVLSAQFGPAWRGDQIISTLGFDALRALRLQGDANFDGRVNLNDFNVLAANFGTTGTATWQAGDFNFDGNVNLNDFNLLAANFGQVIGGPSVSSGDWSALASAVPEPTIGCALIGAAAAMGSRRRRS
jgi:hypothetical protein